MAETDWKKIAHDSEAAISKFRGAFSKIEETLRIGHSYQDAYDHVVKHVERVYKERNELANKVDKLQYQLDCIREAFKIIQGGSPNGRETSSDQ